MEAPRDRWQHHFNHVLNIPRPFDESVVSSMDLGVRLMLLAYHLVLRILILPYVPSLMASPAVHRVLSLSY